MKNCISLNSQSEYNAVDAAKFICSILVIAIHIAPFGVPSSRILQLFNYGIQKWLGRIAVPFFFIASGFFLYRKTSPGNFNFSGTRKYLLRIFRLYLLWSLIYLPLSISNLMAEGRSVITVTAIYIKYFIFYGSYSHLWYLQALILAVSLVSFLLSKETGIKKILFISFIFYLFGLLGQSWYGLTAPLESMWPRLWNILESFTDVTGNTRNGLFEGFLFVAMGASFAFYGTRLTCRKSFVLFLVSFSLMFAEVIFVKYFNLQKEYDTYLFLAPSAYFAFASVTMVRINSDSRIFRVLRILSSLIFYTHLWIGAVSVKLPKLLFDWNTAQSPVCFILVTTCSIIFSYVFYRVSKNRHFSWLEKFYM